jgi:hypothetical protein
VFDCGNGGRFIPAQRPLGAEMVKKLFAVMFLVIALAAAAETALAQCAMCKESVAASDKAATLSSGLNLAVLVLLLPAVAMFVGLFGVFLRYRNPQDKSPSEDEE